MPWVVPFENGKNHKVKIPSPARVETRASFVFLKEAAKKGLSPVIDEKHPYLLVRALAFLYNRRIETRIYTRSTWT